jgi:hypothetical protein
MKKIYAQLRGDEKPRVFLKFLWMCWLRRGVAPPIMTGARSLAKIPFVKSRGWSLDRLFFLKETRSKQCAADGDRAGNPQA